MITRQSSFGHRGLGVVAVGLGRLDGVIPGGFAGDDVGVEVEEDGLAGAIAGLLEKWKI